MVIEPVSQILNAAGFDSPTLNALIPNAKNYCVLLMQPRGQIEADAAGVRNRDVALATRQFSSFLDDACESQADLVITPEYSMPWTTLFEAVKGGKTPGEGRLWVLGCESIRYDELEVAKIDLAPFATVLYEPLQADPARFTDPLAYVFQTPKTAQGESRLIVLVQFKTFPMGDLEHFETNRLQLGNRIYRFGGENDQSLRLVSLICSDAFEFLDPDAEATYDRALVIHIQLNAKPRHEQYRLYRDRLMRFQGDQTEIICLNWARDVEEWDGENSKAWNNISASAWYLKPDKFDQRDATLSANHRKGLYYTWLRPFYTHALFFNYKPATYRLQATKVAHIGVPAAVSRRRGPQLIRTSIWNDAATAWVEQEVADDGFSDLVAESGNAKAEVQRVATENPIVAERVFALCAGEIGHEEDWHNVRTLDSCAIDTSEIICRITFCQDTDERASRFRVGRLKRCGSLWDILKTTALLPTALADLAVGFQFTWSLAVPHQNALSDSGRRATVIYMGEENSLGRIEAVFERAAAFLQRSFADPDEGHSARQRLAVWYRGGDGKIVLYDRDRFTNYSAPGDAPAFDIARET